MGDRVAPGSLRYPQSVANTGIPGPRGPRRDIAIQTGHSASILLPKEGSIGACSSLFHLRRPELMLAGPCTAVRWSRPISRVAPFYLSDGPSTMLPYHRIQTVPFWQFHALYDTTFSRRHYLIFRSRYFFAIGLSLLFSFRWYLPPIKEAIPNFPTL